MLTKSLFLLLTVTLTMIASSEATFGVYFVNWAKYRPSPYTFTAQTISPVIAKVDEIYYSFYYFCPPPGTNPMPYWALPPYGSCSDATAFQLMSVEPSDAQYIPTIVGYKSINPRLKVYLSIGGWNFPSNYFSIMVSSASSRQIFINSVVQTLQQYNLDGVDIDWEYPSSPPRMNPVEISCDSFRNVQDNGGNNNDGQNLALLARELKSALGSKLLTIASQAAKTNEDKMNIKGVTPYIDKWHIMSYDYAVSDIPDASGAISSPNCPLYLPPSPAVQMSVNKTVYDYLAVGVPPNKIMLGIPFYGHTWYIPGASAWNTFGARGQIQGQCCGPFQQTYGAQPGAGCSMCGTMMYSEIQAARPQNTILDPTTQSNIAYFTQQGADGHTASGTWVSYNDKDSINSLVKFALFAKLDGAFGFDASMDSVQGGSFTFDLMNTMSNALKGGKQRGEY